MEEEEGNYLDVFYILCNGEGMSFKAWRTISESQFYDSAFE